MAPGTDVCLFVFPVCDHRRHYMLCYEADIPYWTPPRQYSDMTARKMPEDTGRSDCGEPCHACPERDDRSTYPTSTFWFLENGMRDAPTNRLL